jgi:hypothetical protein
MKAQDVTPELIESITIHLIDDGIRRAFGPVIISTDDIAKFLWEKHRVHIWKDVEKVRQTIRKWWSSKEKSLDPLLHWFVGEYAVFTTSPMRSCYCILPSTTGETHGLIFLHTDQSRFKHRKRST